MNPIATSTAGACALPRPGLSEGGQEIDPGGRTCVVVNRRARGGDADLAPALDTLTRAFGAPLLLEVDEPGRLGDDLDAVCGADVARIVVAGGDGTVNTAVDVALRRGKPLGILPLGTANDFARTLGIPADLAAAAEVIARASTRRIDVGVVNGRHFLNAAGIGFSTGLDRELPGWAKRRFGALAYPLGVIRRWRRHRPFAVEVRDGGTARAVRAIQVTVANGRFYGGGMLAEQEAEIDDGRLELIVVLPSPWWRHVRSVIGLRRGVYPSRAPVIVERRTRFDLYTRRPHAIATDGESSTSTPASFGLLPGALEVYAP